MTARYRVNSPKVTHQTIDHESVMIDLENGNYYSLNRVGSVIWNLLDEGATVGQIVEAMRATHHGEPDQIAAATLSLIEELLREELIIVEPERAPASGGNAADRAEQRRESAVAESGKLEFEMPALQKYTDMQDLLLLDPIHEVDEAGWPQAKVEPLSSEREPGQYQ